ncbi:efflux RND transporter periplasmic adaptor subunit [Fretibacter rubidus]|uniref:efflux RND transporter periplasmic adaptor subunit n=1 Tax=Fretibacter rubidus TaxID=570162 RepID=UPI003529EA36
MKINTSYVISGLAVLIIALWFLLHALADETTETVSNPFPEAPTPKVVTQMVTATDHPNTFRLYGRTEPNREVSVKAETAGIVVSTPVSEGTTVKRGTTLCRQDVDARQARLDQARAQLKSAQFDRSSTQTLVDKGYRSATQLESLNAQVDGARASVKQAEIELDNVNTRAPFEGIFDKRMAEIGDYLAPGQSCGLLIDLDPLVIVADLTETQVGKIVIGQEASVKLATGQDIVGKVRFIESRANSSTRTFRTEVIVPNPDMQLRGGVTATVRMIAGQTQAHQIPASVLALNDDGVVGVRYVDLDNRVRFVPTVTIDESASGVWVTGLPERANVIVKGQDFVKVGTEVETVPASSLAQRATTN